MQDHPQDFEKLRQLLALKRHEIPPPGYFRDFSSRLLTRLEEDRSHSEDGWLTRLTALFQTRPAISWSFGMASCLVVVAATTLFETDPPSPAGGTPAMQAIANLTDQPSSAPAAGAFLVTNLEPRQFALEMAPPPSQAAPSNSLFSFPFYLRQDLRPEFRGEQIPASYETFSRP
jgi:hypothetical protein